MNPYAQRNSNSNSNSNNIPLLWWESSGFLYGNDAAVNVDDPTRISTNVFQVRPASDAWAPLATGVFNIPSSVDGEPPTAPRPHGVDAAHPLWLTYSTTPLAAVDRPDVCKLNCTMGGCSDPTTSVYDACMEAGCCNPHPPAHAPADPPVTTNNVSQMAWGDQDCTLGPSGASGYCRSQYTYKQCKPGSLLNAWEDPDCASSTGSQPVPYYVVW